MEKKLLWEDLRDKLYPIIGNRNVYYNPPTSIVMRYPCFRFERTSTESAKADNYPYMKKPRWTVMYISQSIEEEEYIINKMLETFKYCTHTTSYRSDNLLHLVFNLYF